MKTSDLTWPPLKRDTRSIRILILIDNNGAFYVDEMPFRLLILLNKQIYFSYYLQRARDGANSLHQY